jgi:glycosyltransferase involved in cell wall biosynthesis
VRFTIVTPSYNNSQWLKLCIPSVADQQGVQFEHIVQDACSTDATQSWLPKDKRVTAVIEKDKGMYDAINRGWRRGAGDYVAWLNCDEQYLPGALKAVSDYAERHPDVDLIVAHTIVVNPDGTYLCHRRSLMPRLPHLWLRFPILSCALFLKRKTLEAKQFYFDTQWRDLGDVHWMMDLVRRGARAGLLHRYTSVFYETGDNMNLKPNARREKEVTNGMMPNYVRKLAPAFIFWHRLRLLASGTFSQKPFDFSLFTPASPEMRLTHHVEKPTPIWRGPDGKVRQ